jgi:hypothetical protein
MFALPIRSKELGLPMPLGLDRVKSEYTPARAPMGSRRNAEEYLRNSSHDFEGGSYSLLRRRKVSAICGSAYDRLDPRASTLDKHHFVLLAHSCDWPEWHQDFFILPRFRWK